MDENKGFDPTFLLLNERHKSLQGQVNDLRLKAI